MQDDEQKEVDRLAALESGKLLRQCYPSGLVLIHARLSKRKKSKRTRRRSLPSHRDPLVQAKPFRQVNGTQPAQEEDRTLLYDIQINSNCMRAV